MIELWIDDKPVQVAEGATILEAARQAGVEIPTLCYLDGCDAETSCMVCLVKLANGKFVPSCATRAVDGMRVESESAEVADARRTALELLLGDHLGDCEAPCQRAHAAGLNIPKMLRLVAAGEFDKAAEVVGKVLPREIAASETDDARYHNACRRRGVDSTVRIAAVVRFLASRKGVDFAETQAKPERRFNIAMGKLSEEELAEFTRVESNAYIVAVEGEELTAEQAVAEAKRCLHCDCRKADDCRLRKWAEVYDAKPGAYRAKHRQAKFDDSFAGVVFEPGKCISCGLCVQILRTAGQTPGLGFQGRGFDVEVKVPFGQKLADAIKDEAVAERVIEACPTAALAWKVKP